MNQAATWSEVQQRASVPGSAILNNWMAERKRAALSVRNASAPGEVLTSGDPRILELFGSNRTASGMAVTSESAMRVSAVSACVARIAGAISQLPVHQYVKTPTGRQRADSPLWWLLNESPTARYTSASMWEQVTGSFLLKESGFVFIGRSRSGAVRELIPLPWDAVQPERYSSNEGDRLKYYVQDVRTYGADQDDMLHFPGFGFDGLRAMSVIQYAARNATGNAMAMDDYSGKFFAGGAHPSMILEVPGGMKAEAVANLQAAFSNKYSGTDNAHKLPLVLTDGIKATSLTIKASDAQLLDARKFQVVDIARAFGVPPHLIGETSAATSWGSGLEEMTRAFMLYTVQPHLRRIEQELNRKLFRTSGSFVEFNRDAMLEGNSSAQADYFRAALGGPGTGPGWMSVDDVRQLKNMQPHGGLSADIYDPRAAQPAPPTAPQPGATV